MQCWLTLLLLALLVWASFAYLALDLSRLFSLESGRGMLQFILRFFPPDTSAQFLRKIAGATLETLAISAIGTLLAAGAGLLLALPAAGRLGPVFKALTRFLLNALRSVPELVWAALMVLAAGLGPFAGTLALALHTSGVLGRLYAESLENAPPEPAQSLVESGAPPALAFGYATLPLIAPQLLSYSLYRWEMNIRMATVLGFVGAGGLGQMLYYELSLLHEAQASSVIFAMLALVVFVDAASAWVRRRQMRAGG
ncbi:MAG: phosphonate ABC transporter, permease protein PhnE [Burkholderiales bacterium]|nr:phosphonate ABC transporter, permease protein PhnE [Burkholderiales bacterium]